MLSKEKSDLVAIATDSGSHAQIGLDCLEHCHVIIEKPIALSISDADNLIKVAENNNKVLAVCHQNRFNKSIKRIRGAMENGRFGKLSHIAAHVRWSRGREYYEQAPWRGKWADDGGCLMNQCIHNADLLHWFIGDIAEVFAYTNNAVHPYIEGEDLGIALIKGKDGTLGLFEGTVNIYPKNLEETLYVFGEHGTAKAAGASVNLIEVWDFFDGQDDPEKVKAECFENPPNVYGFGHTPFYMDVVDAIRTGRPPVIGGKEGKDALELILAIYKSQKTGLPVALPLGHFASADMEGIFCSL
jgi:predicted dehydrogenase